MKLHRSLFVFFLVFLLITGTIWSQEIKLYKVRSGDSLSKIANQFNIAMKQIISLNQIENPDLIRVGQELKIPTENKVTTKNRVTTTKKTIYKIKKGDTLSNIAQKFSITTKKLVSINNIKNPDRIYIGQELEIPVENERRTQTVSRYQQSNFIWPAQGEISSSYGWRQDPITSKREFHNGIDIALTIGSPVYASETGVVSFSGWSGGYGKLIVIKHRDNKTTYYGHNVELLVEKGDRVPKGKVIALSGNSGRSTGPHLHFEIRNHNRIHDPMNYLNKKYMQNGFRV